MEKDVEMSAAQMEPNQQLISFLGLQLGGLPALCVGTSQGVMLPHGMIRHCYVSESTKRNF